MGVVVASLRSANPIANIILSVPSVDSASLWISVRGSESASTLASFLAEEPAFITDPDLSPLAVHHVPVEAWLGIDGVEATARAAVWVPEVALLAGLILGLASTTLRIPLISDSAGLRQALTVIGNEVEVETNGTVAVLRQARKGSGLPVFAIDARLVRRTEALACDVIKVAARFARAHRVLNALAVAVITVPD